MITLLSAFAWALMALGVFTGTYDPSWWLEGIAYSLLALGMFTDYLQERSK